MNKIIIAIACNNACCDFCDWKSEIANIIKPKVNGWQWKRQRKACKKIELILDYPSSRLPIGEAHEKE